MQRARAGHAGFPGLRALARGPRRVTYGDDRGRLVGRPFWRPGYPDMSDQEIGEIRGEFKPGLENIIAGFIIGLLLIGAGGAGVYFPVNGVIEARGNLPFWVEKGWCWGAVGLGLALAIGAIVGGVILILWMRSLTSLRVRVGAHGLSVTRKDETRVIAWPDIVSVLETHLYERPPILKGVAKYALAKVLSKFFALATKEGEPFRFDGNTIKGHVILADIIKKETDRRGVPWEVVEEYSG